MRKLKLFSRVPILAFLLVLLTTVFGVGNAWAVDDETVEVTIYASSGDYYAKTHDWQGNGAQVYDQVVLDAKHYC